MAAKLCKPCSGTCGTCHGPNTSDCLSCIAPLILSNGSCVNFCPDGTFVHVQGSGLACAKCDHSCLTCTGNATACTSCTSEYRNVPGKCVKKCAEGSYADARGQCQSCHPSCRNCNDGSASSCTECGTKDDRQLLFLHKGECKAACPNGLLEKLVARNANLVMPPVAAVLVLCHLSARLAVRESFCLALLLAHVCHTVLKVSHDFVYMYM